MMTTPIDSKNNASISKDILMTGINKSALRLFIATLSLILFIALVCLSYSIGIGEAENGAIPIIRADGSAIKKSPENPAGKQYPHQDLTIYNSFRKDTSNKDIQLKDDIEKPTSSLFGKPDNADTQIADLTPVDDTIQLTTVSETQTPERASTEPAKTDIKTETKSVQTTTEEKINKILVQNTLTKNELVKSELALQKQVKAPIEAKPVPVKIQPTVPTKPTLQNAQSGNSYLQIGAYRSEADALSSFRGAKNKFSELASAGHSIVKADLGSKGVYYRLRVGPFATKEQSLNVCSQLQAKGQACLHITIN